MTWPAHVELKYAYFAQKTAKDTISSWLSLDFLFLFVVNQFLFLNQSLGKDRCLKGLRF